MAYSLIAKKEETVDWTSLHKVLSQNQCIECFPISAESGNTLGISIPFNNVRKATFPAELKTVLDLLLKKNKFTVFDLYTGRKVKMEHFEQLLSGILN